MFVVPRDKVAVISVDMVVTMAEARHEDDAVTDDTGRQGRADVGRLGRLDDGGMAVVAADGDGAVVLRGGGERDGSR